MIIRSTDIQGLIIHTPPPMLSGIPMPTHTISYAVQNYQTLEWFLESLYLLDTGASGPERLAEICKGVLSESTEIHQ